MWSREWRTKYEQEQQGSCRSPSAVDEAPTAFEVAAMQELEIAIGCIQWTKDSRAMECMATLCVKSMSSAVIIASNFIIKSWLSLPHWNGPVQLRRYFFTSSVMFCFIKQAPTCMKSANEMATEKEQLRWRLTCRANDECQNIYSSFAKTVCHVHSL